MAAFDNFVVGIEEKIASRLKSSRKLYSILQADVRTLSVILYSIQKAGERLKGGKVTRHRPGGLMNAAKCTKTCNYLLLQIHTKMH